MGPLGRTHYIYIYRYILDGCSLLAPSWGRPKQRASESKENCPLTWPICHRRRPYHDITNHGVVSLDVRGYRGQISSSTRFVRDDGLSHAAGAGGYMTIVR
jgi:hypothetical protein